MNKKEYDSFQSTVYERLGRATNYIIISSWYNFFPSRWIVNEITEDVDDGHCSYEVRRTREEDAAKIIRIVYENTGRTRAWKKRYDQDEKVRPVTGLGVAIISDHRRLFLACESQVTRNPVGTWTTLAHLFSIYVQRFSRTTSSSNEKPKLANMSVAAASADPAIPSAQSG